MTKIIMLASAYLRQAYSRLKDAKDALNDKNYPYALRLSQEAVELSLKASLRLVGIEYPKVHDVSDILLDVGDRFPKWFMSELRFLAKASYILASKREIAFYGGEEELLSPDELIDRNEGKEAVEMAEKVYTLCKKFLDEIKEKSKA